VIHRDFSRRPLRSDRRLQSFLQPRCVGLDGTGWGLLGLPVTGDESPAEPDSSSPSTRPSHDVRRAGEIAGGALVSQRRYGDGHAREQDAAGLSRRWGP
jgi:hypothetical protein